MTPYATISYQIIGLIGTAPSQELLDIWNTRERELVEAGEGSITLGSVLHTRPLAGLPNPKGALLGKIAKDSEEWDQISKEAARTIPGRENGGNCDIKFLSKGSKIYLPVFVEGDNTELSI
jgi:formamidase